jgi:hypothetical protein
MSRANQLEPRALTYEVRKEIRWQIRDDSFSSYL